MSAATSWGHQWSCAVVCELTPTSMLTLGPAHLPAVPVLAGGWAWWHHCAVLGCLLCSVCTTVLWCLSGLLTWLCGSCVLQQALLPPAWPPRSLLLPFGNVAEAFESLSQYSRKDMSPCHRPAPCCGTHPALPPCWGNWAGPHHPCIQPRAWDKHGTSYPTWGKRWTPSTCANLDSTYDLILLTSNQIEMNIWQGMWKE